MTSARILVAHSELAVREAAARAVSAAGYDAVCVSDGIGALEVLLGTPRPAALVVDVALPELAGYQLCDEIAKRKLDVRVILIASVYSKTAYKRRPTSLYGADDYVEQHHVIDLLAPKLAALVPPPGKVRPCSVHDRSTLSPEERRDSDRLQCRSDARLELYGLHDRGFAGAVERARTLARVIVADMVLYNGGEIERLKGQGERLERAALSDRLLRDLDEARRLFALGVPRDVAQQRDFVLEALVEFVNGRG
jgi:CheY-like chemotaxis protein